MAIQLITDSTAYISQELIDQYKIKVLPLVVNFEDESFLDLPEYFSAFYKKLASVNYIPKSSQPSAALMFEAFHQAMKSGHQVIAVFLSSKMSGTFNTAMMIKEQVLEHYPKGKITVIDSGSNSMQMGHVVLAGARAIKTGKSYDEAISQIEKTIPRTKFIFSPATLEYLKRGGRIGSAEAFLGQILQVKPILTVDQGITSSLDKVRTRKKSIQYMVNTFMSDIESYGLENVIIHHIEDEKEADKIKTLIEEKTGLESVQIMDIGPVIGTHVGPGAIGIAYETKEIIK